MTFGNRLGCLSDLASLDIKCYCVYHQIPHPTTPLGGTREGKVPPLTSKNLPKIGKKRKKSGKLGKKEGKSGRKGKNRKVLSLCPS